MSNGDIVILEVCVPSSQTILFQGLLNGEDGLAVMRSLNSDDRNMHELWTVPDQLPELYAWIETLPPELDVNIVGENRNSWRDRK